MRKGICSTVVTAAVLLAFGLFRVSIAPGLARQQGTNASPQVPRTWDDAAVASLEVPLANPACSPVHVSSDNYYRLPVRPVYKSYPIYAPGKEPSGYIEWLQQQEPEI